MEILQGGNLLPWKGGELALMEIVLGWESALIDLEIVQSWEHALRKIERGFQRSRFSNESTMLFRLERQKEYIHCALLALCVQ